MVLTEQDIKELELKDAQIEKKIIEQDRQDKLVKKELILEWKEVKLMKFELGLLPVKDKHDLCAFLYHRYTEELGISYSRQHWNELFKDDEKQLEYIRSDTKLNEREAHVWLEPTTTQDGTEIQDCSHCRLRKINGIPFEPMAEDQKKPAYRDDKYELYKDEELLKKPETRYLIEAHKNHSKTLKLLDAVFRKIKEGDDEIIRILNTPDLKQKIKEHESFGDKLDAIAKRFDFRNKLGEFEKIMAKLLLDTGTTLAHLASILGISSKHVANNIDRQSWYDKIRFFRSCPSCGDDIADKINEEIVRYEKHEGSDDFVLKTKVPPPK